MSDPGRFPPSAGPERPAELTRLSESLKDAAFASEEDAGRVQAALDGVTEMVNRRRRVLHLVQDALSQLRLDVKYLMFDLEVTRRERDELRSRLNEIERGY